MRFCNFTPALALMLLLSACGGSTEDNQATETRMDNLDRLEGTISDDMINTDEAIDDVPVQSDADVSAPVASADAAPAKTDAADTAKVEASGESK
jgi:hypothetical protein